MPVTQLTPEPAAPSKPQGCTNLKLRQLMRRVAQHYDAEVGKAGLKTTQYSLLSCLAKLGDMKPGGLAKVLKLDASTLSRNLKPLVAAGWIVLEPGADGRSRLVSITAQGRAKRHEAQRRWRVAQDDLNSLLGLPNVTALHALIDDSLARLAPVDGEPDDE